MNGGTRGSARALVATALAALVVASCDSVVMPDGADGPGDAFMFCVFDAGHHVLLGSDFASGLKDDLNENLAWTAPPYFWSEIEPIDNQFDWTELDGFIDGNSDKHRVVNLGPEFMATGDGDFYISGELPGWIDNSYLDPELKNQYGELLEAIVERYKDDVDMWWIGLEVNLGGDGMSWEEWKDWLEWQTGLMRSVDPDARIAISFGSWTDYFEPMPPNAIHEIDGALELAAEGTEFDVIAIEYHYGTLQAGDTSDLGAALEDLKSVGKDIFIWEVFYPGGTDPTYQDCWSWVEEPDCGYTEEWQAEQWVETLEMAYQDPLIVGINVLHLQDITYALIDPADWEAGWRCHAGLVRADGTPRQAYHDVKAYWESVSGR